MNKDINNIPPQNPYKKLTPFCLQIIQNFPFIEADFDAITNQQLLQKVVDYLNQVIANENAVTENIQNLYNAFVELENYVNNYFNDLDIQTEINNKLDKMAQDGTLAEIIEGYATIPQLTNQINQIQNNDIPKINSRLDTLENEEIIIVGDSYLAGQGLDNPTTENFGYILMTKLGMSTDKFHIWAEGGSSFTNAGNQGHTWQTLVQSKLETITPKNIKKIIFAGGYNDIVATTPTQIETAMNNCIDYVKSVLPNATIYIDLIGNNGATTEAGATARNLLKNRIYNIYSKCFRKRAIFLDKGQLALQDYKLYENHANKVHPNLQGQQEIANYLYQSLLKAPGDYRKDNNAFNGTIPDTISSSTSFIFAEKLFNNIVKLYCLFNFTLANSLALGYNTIDLGEQTSIKFLRYNSVAIGNNSNSNFIGVSDINTSQLYMLPCRMYVNNSNHLILSCYNEHNGMRKIITPGWINFDFDVQSV